MAHDTQKVTNSFRILSAEDLNFVLVMLTTDAINILDGDDEGAGDARKRLATTQTVLNLHRTETTFSPEDTDVLYSLFVERYLDGRVGDYRNVQDDETFTALMQATRIANCFTK